MKTRKRNIRPVHLREDEGLAEVPLTRGHVALVDLADVALVSAHNWQVMEKKSTNYASARIGDGRVAMHRLIMDVTDPDLEVHHKNGNGLDNRRENLEVMSKREHRRVTQRELKDSRYSRYTYVTVVARDPYRDGGTKFRAAVQEDGRLFYLGDYRDEKLAAMVGDLGAQYVFEGDAYRNFPTATPEAHRYFKKYLAAYLMPRANLSSRYRGVTLARVNKKDGAERWCAQLLVTQSDCIKVNSINTQEEAAWIHDALVLHFRGLSSPRNFDTLPPAYAMEALAKVLERRAGQGKTVARAA